MSILLHFLLLLFQNEVIYCHKCQSAQTGLKSFVEFKPNGLSSFVFRKKFPFIPCGVANPMGTGVPGQYFAT